MRFMKLRKIRIDNPYQETFGTELVSVTLENKTLTPQELEDLCQKHIPLAARIVSGYACLAIERTNDMLGEGILAIWQAASNLDKMKDTNFTAYCACAIHNAVIRFLRREHVLRNSRKLILESNLQQFSISRDIRSHKIRRRVVRILETLDACTDTDLERKIIKLRIQGYKDQEIGSQLGYSTAYIHKVRVRVADRVRRDGYL